MAQPQSWFAFAAGVRSGVTYGASFAQGNCVRAELYLGTSDAALNKSLFDRLLAEKEAIERDFGGPLEWERLDEKQASRVATYREGNIEVGEDALAEIRAWTVDTLLRLKRIMNPRLSS